MSSKGGHSRSVVHGRQETPQVLRRVGEIDAWQVVIHVVRSLSRSEGEHVSEYGGMSGEEYLVHAEEHGPPLWASGGRCCQDDVSVREE